MNAHKRKQSEKLNLLCTGQMAQGERRLHLVLEVWGLNPEQIKSPTLWQRHATVATLKCGPWCKDA